MDQKESVDDGSSRHLSDAEYGLHVICSKDPIIAFLAERHGPPVLERKSLPSSALDASKTEDTLEHKYFAELVDIVIHQQLAGAAAVAISKRFRETVGDRIEPDSVLSADPDRMLAAGLSRAKLNSIIGLAAEVGDRSLSLTQLRDFSDLDVVSRISKLRGFGPWSAQMFLMFTLGRLNIWPVGDLGVRKGYKHCYGLDEVPSPKELEILGERFAPYRSIVAWYMWRSLSEPIPADLKLLKH